MQKVTAYGHQAVLDPVVAALQRFGALQVTTRVEEMPSTSDLVDEERLRVLEECAGRADFVRDFLKRFHEPDVKFGSFVSEKFHLTEDEFLALEADEEFHALYEECQTVSGRLAEVAREIGGLQAVVAHLEPWLELTIPIHDLVGTRSVALVTGTVPATKSIEIREQLREAATDLSVAELGTAGNRQAWVVMVHEEHHEEVRNLLVLADFEEVGFDGLEDRPVEESDRAKAELERLADEEDELVSRATELEAHFGGAVALSEALAARRAAIHVRKDFASTEATFVVEGWVKRSDVPGLEGALADFDHVDVEARDAAEDEEPPTALENPRWLRPFEVLTDLYGRPAYDDFDPTPLMAGFFFLFFGMCIGDFGYGLTLMAVAWLIKHRLDVADGVKRFMDLLMYGGLSSAVVGVVTGSYFALQTDQLPGFLRALIILEPLEELTTLLLFTIALGVIHVMFGTVIQIVRRLRQGDIQAAVLDEASTVLLWLAVPLAVLVPDALAPGLILAFGVTTLMKGHVVVAPLAEDVPSWDRALGWVWVASLVAWLVAWAFGAPSVVAYGVLAVTVVGLAARTVRKGVIGVLAGAYETFNVLTGYVSDFLSYTRLAALGLASILVGWVMNIMAGMMPTSGVMAIVGILFAALILIGGHSLNLAINLLGAFVHPLRLQFVEFFTKFYEAGGVTYTPFGFGTRSLVLHREPVQEEGGTGS
jgi:V/A-type H+-transporting ATPase subunit I